MPPLFLQANGLLKLSLSEFTALNKQLTESHLSFWSRHYIALQGLEYLSPSYRNNLRKSSL